MDEQALRRVSDPFELELQRSPGPSPSIDSAEKRFEYQQDEQQLRRPPAVPSLPSRRRSSRKCLSLRQR